MLTDPSGGLSWRLTLQEYYAKQEVYKQQERLSNAIIIIKTLVQTGGVNKKMVGQ